LDLTRIPEFTDEDKEIFILFSTYKFITKNNHRNMVVVIEMFIIFIVLYCKKRKYKKDNATHFQPNSKVIYTFCNS